MKLLSYFWVWLSVATLINTSTHHHFYDEDTCELIDCETTDIEPINVNKNITGKKINSVEVLIKVASDNHNQK